MSNDNLITNAEHLGWIIGSLAAFAEAPTPAQMSDLKKSLGEYQERWIKSYARPDVDGDGVVLETNDEAAVVVLLQGLRMGIIDRDPRVNELLAKLGEAVVESLSGGESR